MPQSFCQIYVHAIFSTKERSRWLDETIRPRAHAYLATLARDCGCPYVVVGGPDDHVHMLVDIGKSTLPVTFIGKSRERFYWGILSLTFSRYCFTHISRMRQDSDNEQSRKEGH